jgi:hypothetical protein
MSSSEKSGTTILILGIVLLLLTFIITAIHLNGEINVIQVPSFFTYFGEFLSPFIEAGIRVLYLGLMGWISLSVIVKGIRLLIFSRFQEKTITKKDT